MKNQEQRMKDVMQALTDARYGTGRWEEEAEKTVLELLAEHKEMAALVCDIAASESPTVEFHERAKALAARIRGEADA